MAGIKIGNYQTVVMNNITVHGFDVGIQLSGAKSGRLDNIDISSGRRLKVGRNQLCPCGSLKKYKHCHGSLGGGMSIGIKSEHSNFTVGKARIIADVGVDLVHSNGHIDDYLHVDPNAPNLGEVLNRLDQSDRPPQELIDQAIQDIKKTGAANAIEKTDLKAWCDKQGINAAMWIQLAAAIGLAALGG